MPGSAFSASAMVTTTDSASSSAGTAEAAMTRAPWRREMPAMPPAPRPCGRTFEASKRSSWASEVTSVRMSESAAVAAKTTRSPSARAITSQESPRLGSSPGLTRLMTPAAVASTIGGWPAEPIGTSPTIFSSGSMSTSRRAGCPPASDGAPSRRGISGAATTSSRTRRPVSVIAPTRPRAVVTI